MIKNLILILLFSGFFQVYAAEKIKAQVYMGDRTTTFDLKDGKESSIQMENNVGFKKSNKLSANNFKVLVQRFNQLKTQTTPETCNRSRMQIQYTNPQGKTVSKESCIGVKIGSANQYQRFANMLVDVL